MKAMAFFCVLSLPFGLDANAAKVGKTAPLRYKRNQQSQNFDSLTVKGQVYRPDLSVVTGDLELGALGALRLRHQFKDQARAALAEETAP